MTSYLYRRSLRQGMASLVVAGVALSTTAAQTKITPPPNKYSIQDDVKLGQEAASEARKQLPMLKDDRIDDYIEDIGRDLVAAAPSNLQQPAFRYSFDVVNQKEINAFALPGGPMFVNRGMIESARTEGEMASVMAHELSHVLLRHGTAQASKGQGPAILGTIGQILGGIVGGAVGSVIGLGSQVGAAAYMTKYTREYERQADLLGAQVMARAGYDPREMANMFRTIEKQGGGGGPEWMSSHPNPGNRAEYITQEARSLRIDGDRRSSAEFQQVQARLRGQSPAYTAQEVAQQQRRGGPAGTSGRSVRVDAPVNQYRTYRTSVTDISVPANWEQAKNSNSVLFAPDGAFYEAGNGATGFTHGVEVGVAGRQTGNLQRDTQALLQGFARSNPQLRQSGGYRQENIDGRRALTATLSNVSDVTGQREFISVATVQLRDGSMLYVIGVAPQPEASVYDGHFRQVRRSLQLND